MIYPYCSPFVMLAFMLVLAETVCVKDYPVLLS